MTGPMLDGRVAVVTGGAAGIGAAITRRFAEESAVVVSNDIDAGRLADQCDDIRVGGREIPPVPGDIRQPATVGIDGGTSAPGGWHRRASGRG